MYYTKRYFCDIIVHWLVVMKAIQKVYTTNINNPKGVCIFDKCCVHTDSFVVTCKFEGDREMERFVTRCLIRQNMDLYQRRIRKLVPGCEKCLICDGDETDVSYHFNCPI